MKATKLVSPREIRINEKELRNVVYAQMTLGVSASNSLQASYAAAKAYTNKMERIARKYEVPVSKLSIHKNTGRIKEYQTQLTL